MTSLLLLIIPFLTCAIAMDNLKVAFQWKRLDFAYPSPRSRLEAIHKSQFFPEENVPLGIEVAGDRLFLTIPRWKKGIAATLAYIKLTDPTDSPKLHPYPDWQAHNQSDIDHLQLVSPSRARADSCGRLWVLDTGVDGILVPTNGKSPTTRRFVVYNLTTDEMMFTYNIPSEQYDPSDSFFTNIAVEENNCTDSFAYLADSGRPSLVVYDLAQNRSWLVKHHFFNIDPLAGSMNVSGIRFQWSDGILGLSLSAKDLEGYSSLYFHPLSSFNEFNVSTKVLRNETLATDSDRNYRLFNVLGSRGPRAQSGASFLHQKSRVLFYSLVNLNAVACWRTTLPKYNMVSQGRIFMSNETMVFPSDIKVDANDTLWVLSNNLPTYFNGVLKDDYNFRILKSSVSDAIRGTACDSKIKLDWKILGNVTTTSGSFGFAVSQWVLLQTSLLVVFLR